MLQEMIVPELLLTLEKREPHDILLDEYQKLMEHFQHWHNCQSPLAERAKTIIRRTYPFLQSKLEKEKS